jgi:hypothetical protein
MSSVLLAGGHFVTQPTVPVALFVLLVIGALLVTQTRTFKVAGELRRSRSRAAVPAFLVGGTAGLVRQVQPSRRESRRERKRAAAAAAAVPEDNRPPWARQLPVELAAPVEKKPGLFKRMIAGLGNAWGRLPERLSRVSSREPEKTVAFTPFSPAANGNVHARNGNGHASVGNGSARHGNGSARHGNGHASVGNGAALSAHAANGNGQSGHTTPRGKKAKKSKVTSEAWTPQSLAGAALRSSRR